MNEKNLRKQILEFLSSVPDVIDVIGYGSGVKEQKNYATNFQKNIDIIATVKDDILWHQENLEGNPEQYSKLAHISNIPLCHYGTDINYLAHLRYGTNLFKLGIIRKYDFLEDLVDWKNFYIAGRLQKSVLEVQTDDEIKEAMRINRKNALRVALLLNYDKDINEYELLYNICNLSFRKDIRMTFKMENPCKVKNILEGSYNELQEIYKPLNEDLFTTKNDLIIPNTSLLINNFDELPSNLLKYLYNHGIESFDLNIDDLKYIRKLITSFLNTSNNKTSTIQPIKSILLNPIKKSSDYAFEKRMKYKGK